MSGWTDEELDALRRLVEMDGWITFTRDAQRQIDALERIALDAKSMEQLAYAKGVRDTLRVIVSFPSLLEEPPPAETTAEESY